MPPQLVEVNSVDKMDKLEAWLTDRLICLPHNTSVMPKTIILVHEQRRAERVATFLQQKGFQAYAVHEGLNQTRKEMIVEGFRSVRPNIIVCTTEIDLPNHLPRLSYIITCDLPPALSAHQYMASHAILIDVDATNDLRVIQTLYNYLVISGLKIPDWIEQLSTKDGQNWMTIRRRHGI